MLSREISFVCFVDLDFVLWIWIQSWWQSTLIWSSHCFFPSEMFFSSLICCFFWTVLSFWNAVFFSEMLMSVRPKKLNMYFRTPLSSSTISGLCKNCKLINIGGVESNDNIYHICSSTPWSVRPCGQWQIYLPDQRKSCCVSLLLGIVLVNLHLVWLVIRMW